MIKRKTWIGLAAVWGLLGMAQAQAATDGPGRVEAHYVDERLNLICTAQPLKRCLQEVSAATGMRFAFADAHLIEQRVSLQFSGLTLPEALLRMLDGYSFIAYPAAPGAWTAHTLKAGRNESQPAVVEAQLPQGPKEPRTLEEFRHLPQSFLKEAPDETEGPEAWAQAVADDRRLREAALVDRAVDAWHSPYKGLQGEALAVLCGTPDPRATDILIAAAKAADRPPRWRRNAMNQLLQHAVSLGFRDARLEQAVQALTRDADAVVRAVAERAAQGFSYAGTQSSDAGGTFGEGGATLGMPD